MCRQNITRPNCAFWDVSRLPNKEAPFVLLLFFHFFYRSDKILTFLKICLWNPGIYRHEIVRPSSAQFGLVVLAYEKIDKAFDFFVDNPRSMGLYFGAFCCWINILTSVLHSCTGLFFAMRFFLQELRRERARRDIPTTKSSEQNAQLGQELSENRSSILSTEDRNNNNITSDYVSGDNKSVVSANTEGSSGDPGGSVGGSDHKVHWGGTPINRRSSRTTRNSMRSAVGGEMKGGGLQNKEDSGGDSVAMTPRKVKLERIKSRYLLRLYL